MIKSGNTIFFLYLVFCIFGIILMLSSFNEQSTTIWDALFLTFYGVSEYGYSITSFFFYCIIYIGYIYLVQVQLTIILTERLYYQLIRYQSLEKWYLKTFQPIIIRIIILLVMLFSITILFSVLKGKHIEFTFTIVDSTPKNLLYHYFVNGFLQMMNFVLIMFIVMWIWNDNGYNLVTMGAFVICCLPFINQKKLLPSGLNGLGHLSGNNHDIYKITIILFIYLLIELVIISFLFKKKIVF